MQAVATCVISGCEMFAVDTLLKVIHKMEKTSKDFRIWETSRHRVE